MARSRNIKPGFYKNEDLAECSIWARFIFPGLWQIADRNGLFEDRPKRIKGELLPYDSVDMEPLLVELHERCFIYRYTNESGRFICIPSFSTHQSPHYSEKPSGIKPPILPDKWRHRSSKNLGEIPDEPERSLEDSGSNPTIKRGLQRPDSLNPDSLIQTPPSPPASRGGVDKPTPTPTPAPAPPRPNGQWWRSDSTIVAKGVELGVDAKAGESMRDYAERLRKAIAQRKAEAEGKRQRRGKAEAPADPVTPARAREPVPFPSSWAVTYSVQLRVMDVQPTWDSDHIERVARQFREVAKDAPAAVDWDEVFVAWCGRMDPLVAREPTNAEIERARTIADGGEFPVPALSSEPPTSDAGEELAIDDSRWWEDPERVMARAVELNVAIFDGENFGDFTARVLAELGPGPHLQEIEDEALLEKINYFQRVGPTSDAARPQPA